MSQLKKVTLDGKVWTVLSQDLVNSVLCVQDEFGEQRNVLREFCSPIFVEGKTEEKKEEVSNADEVKETKKKSKSKEK